ncbi:hypothetical protein [Phytomonospora endophytica]|uniref:Uncharacterized protein n=1 Tax=Phytomonospora endophytica TaxID=714109 RepID=A0A841FU23_9ACTN|nr:hypothetical protein [Phytomonospora endophytica]MBB6036029.1 hypothetical protein [Phytomonospora endophytica]GIG66934.1 hypothetical protein Pen01_32290 [Phytomonospora endophytica]
MGEMTLWTDIAFVGATLGGAIVIVGALAIWISRLHPAPGGEKELAEVTDLVVNAEAPVAH